jgi:hypothetical protein
MNGIIRKIIVGIDPKNAMAYYVGMPARKNDPNSGKVCAIVFDERSYEVNKKERYFIYLQEESGSQVLWKAINEMPSIIEFDLNF